jgi:hypothetical protein
MARLEEEFHAIVRRQQRRDLLPPVVTRTAPLVNQRMPGRRRQVHRLAKDIGDLVEVVWREHR